MALTRRLYAGALSVTRLQKIGFQLSGIYSPQRAVPTRTARLATVLSADARVYVSFGPIRPRRAPS
jgi:hypothetical protein